MILLALAVVIVALTCARLGLWQLDRLEGRRAFNTLLEERLALPAAPLDALAGTPGHALRYRRVTVQGTFDPAREAVLFGRPSEGEPGNHVLTPLMSRSGRTLIVDRGWVPIDDDTPPVAVATPPDGEVLARGVLLPTEAASTFEGPPGSPTRVGSVDVELLTRGTPDPFEEVYLLLGSQAPAQATELPRPVPLPVPDEGPHLSYAIQWFIFATIALVGYGVLVRKELRRPATAAGAGQTAEANGSAGRANP